MKIRIERGVPSELTKYESFAMMEDGEDDERRCQACDRYNPLVAQLRIEWPTHPEPTHTQIFRVCVDCIVRLAVEARRCVPE